MGQKTGSIIPVERVESRILLIRGQKVIIDFDLAELYGVTTSRLNEQVKRNQSRFPADFMFQLDREEFENLRSHFATSKNGRGGRRYAPAGTNTQTAIRLSQQNEINQDKKAKHPINSQNLGQQFLIVTLLR